MSRESMPAAQAVVRQAFERYYDYCLRLDPFHHRLRRFTLPTLIVWMRCPLKYWSHPGVAATAALAVLLVLHMIDNILNGMLDPVFILAMGGLAGVAPERIEAADYPGHSLVADARPTTPWFYAILPALLAFAWWRVRRPPTPPAWFQPKRGSPWRP